MWPALYELTKKENLVYVEGIYDTSGAHGIYLFFPSGKSFVIIEDEETRVALLEQIFSDETLEKAVFGFRSLVEVGLDKVSKLSNVTDVEILYGCEQLPILVRTWLSEKDYTWLYNETTRFEAHIKAAKTSLVPLDTVAIHEFMPPRFFESFYKVRAIRTLALKAKRPQSSNDKLTRLAIVLSRAERDGYVDNGVIVHPSFNVVGGKTRRIATRKNSVSCMSLQHGERRRAITSRFQNGFVCSMDFNAIDYRCIVASDEKLKSLYGVCDDFHEKTVEILTGKTPSSEIRNLFKNLTYVHFYGGSKETCQKTTGLPMEKVEQALNLFNQKLGEVKTFTKLLDKGLIEDKFGFSIETPKEDIHEGAKLALYAQTCSSHVFKECVVALGEKLLKDNLQTKLMFTVHDEVLLDVFPAELEVLPSLKKTMEDTAEQLMGIKFVVRMKVGRDYDEIT